MIKTDLHTHTVFCDGKNTPEQMVLSAIDKGLDTIGMVVHSYTEFDTSYCVSLENEKIFKKTVAELKQKYADKINVRLGIEQDVFATNPATGYDYIIGSCHYFKVEGKYYHVDHCAEDFISVVNNVFRGDYYSATENYFNNLKNSFKNTNADIIGHFDLINKFNEGDRLFSTKDQRYVKAYREAVDALMEFNVPFEINTGAIARGYRTEPYPQREILSYIKSKGGKFVMSSDSHSVANIAFSYNECKDYAEK